MRTFNLLRRKSLCIVAMSCTLVTIASALAQLNAKATAVSGVVTGNVQEVGFRGPFGIISLDQQKIRTTNLCDFFFKETRIVSTKL
jgi:nucleoside-triphosphatase THEP1